MRKTLEDLYYGEIRPHDREIEMDSELGKAMGRAERCEEKLAVMLEGEANGCPAPLRAWPAPTPGRETDTTGRPLSRPCRPCVPLSGRGEG